MTKHHYRILSLLVFMLVAAQAQEVSHPVILKRYSSLIVPIPASGPVFITEDKRIEYALPGYVSWFGQLTFKKRLDLFRGTEIGFGIGLPYTIVTIKTILKEFDVGTIIMSADLGLLAGGRELGVLTTLGKVSLSYGKSLRNGINRKIEVGYGWYPGITADFPPSFPRTRTVYSVVAFGKNIGTKISLTVFGGPVQAYFRIRPPQGDHTTVTKWGNTAYVTLLKERYYHKDDIYGWSKQWFFNAGITLNYEF